MAVLRHLRYRRIPKKNDFEIWDDENLLKLPVKQVFEFDD